MANIESAAIGRYTRVAIALHWLIAAFIVYNLVSGWYIAELPSIFRDFHVSAGLTVLILTLARIGWRLLHRPPPHDDALKPWEKGLANLTHICLYAGMLVLPLTGWITISLNPLPGSEGAAYLEAMKARVAIASGHAPAPRHPPLTFWRITKIPRITPLQRLGARPEDVPSQLKWHDNVAKSHEISAIILLLLLALHLAGALKHEWFDGRPQLRRMGLPGRHKARGEITDPA
ncbi:cytochrome b [Sphingomonas sp. Root710]|uniref:cytochrome b n=1 Tax=Sphingomonas sp. Root710 TaxID=1736594 RepID=UPI000A8EB562|nr:cytochrome b/b6 domain-containing protein [Sphingomonas sp. Root710]